MKYVRNIYMEMSVGVERMDPEVRREAWAGNGGLNIVNVDMGIEAMG